MINLSLVLMFTTNNNEVDNINKAVALTTDTGATASNFAGGDGSLNNPYQISSAMELRYLCSQTDLWNASKYFKLTADIEYTTTSYTAIGDGSIKFNGTFDGDEHKITFTQEITVSTQYGGIFGYIDHACITNLVANWQAGDGVIVKSSGMACAGGIAGESNNSTISNCCNEGNVSATSNMNVAYAGGIVGDDVGGTITSCYNVGDVKSSGTACAGGISGNTYGSTISNCYNEGNIDASSSSRYIRAGGIVGDCRGKINNCYNIGRVIATSTSGYVYAGGIAGESTDPIDNCFSIVGDNANISATGQYKYAGGIVGQWDIPGNIDVFNCFYDCSGTATNINSIGTQVANATAFATEMKKSNTYINGTTVGDVKILWESAHPWDFSYIWKIPIDGESYPTLRNLKTIDALSDIKSQFSGDGTELSPYEIADKADLAFLCSHSITLYDYLNSAHFKLTNSIIWDDSSYTPIFANGDLPFNGKFDGSENTITFTQAVTIHSQYVGILGNVKDGSITNLGVNWKEGLNVSTNSYWSYVGGIVGNCEGTISNCYNTSSISAKSNSPFTNVGGIVGYSKGAIVNCYNTGSISSTSDGTNVGGIAGSAYTISSCYNTGDIRANSTTRSVYAGGIVASAYAMISSCYNTGDVNGEANSTLSDTTTSCYGYLGGIVGNSSKKISNCYNIGNVSVTSDSISTTTSTSSYAYNRSYAYAGGIAGYSKATISNCYNIGNLESSAISSSPRNISTSSYAYAGGVTGYSENTISNCYNTGSLTLSATTGATSTTTSVSNYTYAGGIAGCCKGKITIVNCFSILTTNDKIVSTGKKRYVGGIVGYNGVATKCYYDYSGTADTISAEGTQITSATTFAEEMKQKSTYTSGTEIAGQVIDWDVAYPWDFNFIWEILPNDGANYPTLKNNNVLSITFNDVKLDTSNQMSLIIYIMQGTKDSYSSMRQIAVNGSMAINLELEKDQTYTILVSKAYNWKVTYSGTGTTINESYEFVAKDGVTEQIQISSGQIPNNWIAF